MRVLLDENLPHDLIDALVGHSVSTVQDLCPSFLKSSQLSTGFDLVPSRSLVASEAVATREKDLNRFVRLSDGHSLRGAATHERARAASSP